MGIFGIMHRRVAKLSFLRTMRMYHSPSSSSAAKIRFSRRSATRVVRCRPCAKRAIWGTTQSHVDVFCGIFMEAKDKVLSSDMVAYFGNAFPIATCYRVCAGAIDILYRVGVQDELARSAKDPLFSWMLGATATEIIASAMLISAKLESAVPWCKLGDVMTPMTMAMVVKGRPDFVARFEWKLLQAFWSSGAKGHDAIAAVAAKIPTDSKWWQNLWEHHGVLSDGRHLELGYPDHMTTTLGEVVSPTTRGEQHLAFLIAQETRATKAKKTHAAKMHEIFMCNDRKC